jgi:Flp pilus assembly protein TadD
MHIRNLICVFMMAGVCAFAQQGPTSQQQQQADQSKDQTATPQKKKLTPEQANPFPEAKSQKAQDAANGAGNATTGSKGYSSSRVDLKRFAPDASREARLSNGHGGFIHDPQLAAKDDKVGSFYLQTGDYKGAYDRYKEATEVAPEDGNAVFGLAQAAKGLGWDKQAITNYTIYLDAVPDGKHAKDARKALNDLESKHKK